MYRVKVNRYFKPVNRAFLVYPIMEVDMSSVDELIIHNQKLVYWCYQKLPQNDLVVYIREELISEGMIGLVKAAQTYNPDTSKFTTYAVRVIRNCMVMFLRRKCKGWGKEISLSTKVLGEKSGHEVELEDLIEDEEAVALDEAAIEEGNREFFYGMLKQFPDRIQEVVRSSLRGLRQQKIAVAIGISQAQVSRYLRRFVAEMKEYVRQEEFLLCDLRAPKLEDYPNRKAWSEDCYKYLYCRKHKKEFRSTLHNPEGVIPNSSVVIGNMIA